MQADFTVIGAGLLGLASAWALESKGYRVEVIESEAGPALGTSFANSGMLTPSMADPWNAPGIWKQILKWLGREDAPMLLRPSALPGYIAWGLQFLRHSAPEHHRRATQANFALAAASLQLLQQLRGELPLNYDLKANGTLQIFRFKEGFSQARQTTERLQQLGLQAQILSASQLLDCEPILAGCQQPLLGGILYGHDETGDAHLFCRGLEQALRQRGVRFHYGESVQSLTRDQLAVRALKTQKREYQVSNLVIAAANGSSDLAAQLGLKLLVRPVKGYSLTAQCEEQIQLPSRAIIDHHLHGAMTPLGQRLRLAGTAELAGLNAEPTPARLDNLWNMLGLILPQLQQKLDRQQALPWAGLRPMSADGIPIIGSSPIKNVFFNTGHGHLGWTQSLGSGRLLADLIAGDRPMLDPEPYRVLR